jgi:hypothetical protein
MKAAKSLRDAFLDWQCRLRRIAVREQGGRPSPGMRPRLLARSGREMAPALTVLLVQKEPEEATSFFRHQAHSTQDPRTRYEKGLVFLQADYFQEPAEFHDRLAAVLPHDSPLAAELVEAGACVLQFEEAGKRFELPCAVRLLDTDDAGRASAIWHNRLFNPSLPDGVPVLLFKPDWPKAKTAP